MKKRILQFTIFILSIVGISFCYSDISPYPFTKSSLLWEIEGPSFPKGSYLFGTMHLVEKDYFYFPKNLEKIVSKTDLLVMEIAGIPNEAEVLKYITLKEGSLFDFFTAEQTDSIFVWARSKMGMSEQLFRTSLSKMKPFVLVQLATQLQYLGKTESYEMKFQSIAENKKMAQKGLETIEFQMSLFDNLKKSEQAEMVMQEIRDSKKSDAQLKQIQQLYKRQNIDSLYMLIQEGEDMLALKQSDFLEKRNHTWIPKIIEMLHEKKCFIAVGAGHLGGKDGIIRLLQKEGYTLTPVEF
jgi:uncharacterized protein YbaP (TraB family)